MTVAPCPLPDDALLQACARGGAYTDCFSTTVPGTVSFERYVGAFYTSPVFRLERWILKWSIAKPSSDQQARELAAGRLGEFAAWSVEARRENQLLMRDDFTGRTRSWLMAVAEEAATRLYFGSAVTAEKPSGSPGGKFSVLLPFHKLYSRVLLQAAANRLISQGN